MTLTSRLLIALAALLAAPTAAPAAAPRPLATLTGSIAPSTHLRPGTPLDFTLKTAFSSVPPGQDFVVQRLVYLFPHGTVVNGRLFPACSVATLLRAHGRLGACPAGSKIGSGTARGTAIALGVTSGARIALFNGPNGRSVTMNVSITTPALIDDTFAAPLVPLRGPYALRLSVAVPSDLMTVLGSDIVTSYIDVTTGATRIVHGVRRGYVEAARCPRSRKARVHGDFRFSNGATATAETTVAC